jgi:hypothetical protein
MRASKDRLAGGVIRFRSGRRRDLSDAAFSRRRRASLQAKTLKMNKISKSGAHPGDNVQLQEAVIALLMQRARCSIQIDDRVRPKAPRRAEVGRECDA